MQGHIDGTFSTFQRDLFESGLASEIGPAAFLVWCAIKSHADFETGKAWPSIRRLCDVTGLADKTISRAIETLVKSHLLRIDQPGNRRRSTRYVACERLDVRLGDTLLCRIVIDYAPAQLRARLATIRETLASGEPNPEAWLHCTIIPGPQFRWNPERGVLEGSVSARQVPADPGAGVDPAALAGALLGLPKAGAAARAEERKRGREKVAALKQALIKK